MIDPKKKDLKDNTLTIIESIDIEEKIRIVLELYKNNILIFETDNFNSFLLENQMFEGIPIILPDPKIKNQGKKIK